VVAALALAGAAPGTAHGAGATVTGDDGNPVALGGPVTIRQMNFDVVPTFTQEEVMAERDFTVALLDQAGQVIDTIECFPTNSVSRKAFGRYRGNGTYTAIVTTYPDTERSADACKSGASEQRFQFTVNAFTAVGPLPAGTLLRAPNSTSSLSLEVPVQPNPGSSTTELRFARGGVIGPDGAISGPSEQGFVDSTTGRASIDFDAAGTYVFVARHKTDDAFTPWSAPVTVRVFAPFDLESFDFADSRGPSYRVKIAVREETATGRVSFALARGKKGGRYRKLGSARIGRGGVVAKRFRQRRTGTYRMRMTFKGSATTIPGRVIQGVRFTRRVVFR